MKVRSRLFHGLCLVALTFAMNGCSDDAARPPQGQSGRLVQGPVLNAKIFADDVSGGVRFTQDAGEVSTTTDPSTGDFTLPTVPGYNYVLVSLGGTDKLTGQAAIQMIAPAGSANVTPLTTLVALDITGTVKAKLEALMPAGVKFDADISTTASPAVLLVAKSVETIVQSMTGAITTKAGAGVISASQVAAIQAQAMQSIASEFAKPAVTATTMAAPANLSTTLQAAATQAATDIHSANTNITIPADTATTIATSAVNATTAALSIGASAVTTAIAGGENAAISSTVAATFVSAVSSAATTAATSITATSTPTSYTAPPIQVVTVDTVPAISGKQTINSISFSSAALDVKGVTTASAIASSGLGVVFSSTTPAVCTVEGTSVSGVAAGMCIIAADQAGDGNYSAASRILNYITVNPGAQSITVTTTAPAGATPSSQFTVAATATSGLPVSYSSGSPSVCTNSGATFTMGSSGTCVVQYNQAGNANYKAAPQVTNTTVVAPTVIPPAAQTIGSIGITPSTLSVAGAVTASASATSGLAVTLSSTTPAVCTVSGTTVTGVTAGTCTIAANQAGNASFNAASQVTRNITVSAGSQTIAVTTTAPTSAASGNRFTVAASASSGLPVAYTSGSASVCTNVGATFTMVASSGTCVVRYNQAGNANYAAAAQVTNSTTATVNVTGSGGGDITGGGSGGTGKE